MKSIRQMRLFGGAGSSSSTALPSSSSTKKDKLFSKRLLVVAIVLSIGFIWTLISELQEERFHRDDPLVGSNSYYIASLGGGDGGVGVGSGRREEGREAASSARGNGAVALGKASSSLRATAAVADALRGVLLHDDNDGDKAGNQRQKGQGNHLDHAYHLLGGPLRAGGGAEGAAAKLKLVQEEDKWQRYKEQKRRQQQQPHINANNNADGSAPVKGGDLATGSLINIPDPYAIPWQYGLRAPKGVGGGEDAEVITAIPQGEPQPLVSETEFFIAPSMLESVKGEVHHQISEIAKRYYDAPDLLVAYQHVMNNQHGVRGGRVLPIDEMRKNEDELPLPHRW